LIYENRKREWVSALAKSYASLNEAFNLSQAENGELTSWAWENSTEYIMEKYLLPYLKVTKNCKFDSGCYAQTIKFLNDTSATSPNNLTDHYKLQLADGTSWSLKVMNAECVNIKSRCMTIQIDVNGAAKPNIIGRDIFYFQVFPYTNQIVPNILLSSPYENGAWKLQEESRILENCNMQSQGGGCAARIIQEGWKMNY